LEDLLGTLPEKVTRGHKTLPPLNVKKKREKKKNE
jgi:hypothetical protein